MWTRAHRALEESAAREGGKEGSKGWGRQKRLPGPGLGLISAQDRAVGVEWTRALILPGFGMRCAAEGELGRGS